MTTFFRHTILLLAVACMIVACKDNAIPSDTLGTEGIKQGKVAYDTLSINLRPATGDTLDVADAVKLCLQMPAGETSKESYYVLGYVSNFTKYETDPGRKEQFDKDFPKYGNRYPRLINKLNNRSVECYRLMSFKGEMFKYLDQLQEGDVIVVFGKLQNWNNTAQISSGGQLVTTTNPNAYPQVYADESFDEGIGAFTVVNKKAASADVWKHIAAKSSSQGFMYATAKIEGNIEEAESWLVSPKMNLAACSPEHALQMTFTHYYVGDKADRDELLKIMVSMDGGSTWAQIPTTDAMWNDGSLPQFQNVTIDMKPYSSSQTQVAFAYKSSIEKAFNWAVKNLYIGEPKN